MLTLSQDIDQMPEKMLVLGEVQAGFLVEVDLQQSGCECPLRTYACPSAGGTLGAGMGQGQAPGLLSVPTLVLGWGGPQLHG